MKEGNVKENKQVEEAINYFEDREISMKVDVDTDKLLKALGVTEEDSFDKQVYRMKTLINRIKELEEKINRLERDKRITIDKLSKLKNGLEDDFPITLGKQQPLWEENQINYIPKQVIRDKIEKIKADEKEYDNKIRFYTIRDTLKFQEIVLKELLKEDV